MNDDITGPEGSAIEVYTAVNGSFDELSGNFTLRYGVENSTWPLPFNATADDVESALEVREAPHTVNNEVATLRGCDAARINSL